MALPDHVGAIREAGVDHVTVTMNAVDPHVAAGIYAWIFYDHARHTGLAAARILIDRQLEGIDMLTGAGVLVKVMIPGVNDGHLDAVNAAVKARGAFLHNVMPLISDPAHGTHYGLTGQRGPTPAELKALQDYLATAEPAEDGRSDLPAIGALLARAYGDFVRSDPLTERVFKVLKEAQERPVQPPGRASIQRQLYKELAAEEHEHVALLTTEYERWKLGMLGHL